VIFYSLRGSWCKVDTTLFIKKIGKDLFLLQIYVDDIIFGSTNQDFCEEFGKMMANECTKSLEQVQ